MNDDDTTLEDLYDPIEGYCVACKDKRDMLEPVAVWTSNALPGTRGVCPVCGSTMFRMGRSYLHGNSPAPEPVQVVPKGAAKGKARRAAYIAACITDADFANQLGKDLQQIGIYTWVDNGEKVDQVSWSNGVHPALEQCTHLIVVLSGFTENTASVQSAWHYFQQEHKPMFLAQTEVGVNPPEGIRFRARFDFTGDYKTSFRALVEALSR